LKATTSHGLATYPLQQFVGRFYGHHQKITAHRDYFECLYRITNIESHFRLFTTSSPSALLIWFGKNIHFHAHLHIHARNRSHWKPWVKSVPWTLDSRRCRKNIFPNSLIPGYEGQVTHQEHCIPKKSRQIWYFDMKSGGRTLIWNEIYALSQIMKCYLIKPPVITNKFHNEITTCCMTMPLKLNYHIFLWIRSHFPIV